MKKRPKEPFIPTERNATVRQQIMEILSGGTFSAKELSAQVKASEKEVYAHLEHIQKTADKKDHHFIVTPAECKKCGFVFSKREKLKKPGKCPECKGESIQEPIFSIQA